MFEKTIRGERRVSASDARANFSRALKLARYAKTATIIEEHGKPSAVIVPLEALDLLRAPAQPGKRTARKSP